MCKAKKYLDEIQSILAQMENDYKILTDKHSKLELAQQDILHTIENSNFNAVEGYKMAKALKDIRNVRREIKNEIDTMNSLKAKIPFNDAKVTKAVNNVIKIETRQDNPKYNTRVLHNHLASVTEIIAECSM